MGTQVKPFVYGGLAACLAEFTTFPIDTVKTRLQLQVIFEGRGDKAVKFSMHPFSFISLLFRVDPELFGKMRVGNPEGA